jgi:hypothetical protein
MRILEMQQTLGNQAVQQQAFRCPLGNQTVQRLLRSRMVQAKLIINQPEDQYEQEANRVADAVVRIPHPDASKGAAVSGQAQGVRIQRMCSECEEEFLRQQTEEEGAVLGQFQTTNIQRMCSECEEELQRQPVEEEEEILQAKAAQGRTARLTPDTEANINALRGGGQPLPQSVRAFFEPRFGHDFSQVRIHADARAADSARVVNARAYTVGRDVVFGAGQYVPETASGQRLLAHELAHVVQQEGATQGSYGTYPVTVQRQGTPPVRRPPFDDQTAGIHPLGISILDYEVP